MRKGQVTMFVVVGIIIVVVVAAGFYLSTQFSKTASGRERAAAIELTSEEAEVTDAVEDCLYTISGEAILLVSKNGGYFDAPKDAFVYSNYVIPLYYDEGEENVPSMEDIEREIEKAIEKKVTRCVSGDVEAIGQPSATVSLSDSVGIDLEYPLEIALEEDSSVVEYFSADVEIDFQKAYDNAMELYNKQKEAKVQDLVEIGETAIDEDYILKFYNLGNTTLYILEFNDIQFEEKNLEYSFAITPVIDIEELKKGGFLTEFIEAVDEVRT